MKARILTIIIGFGVFLSTQAQEHKPIAPDSLNTAQKIFPNGDIKENNPVLSGKDLVESNFLGSWPMFGTDLRMKIGGYVKADFVYDVDGTTDRTQFLMSTIPVEGQAEFNNSGYINMFAKETRVNVDVRRVQPGSIPLRMFVEGDFFSASSQFRLRHAYMVVGKFIIGQTWTNLSVLEALPFAIDFAAGDALYGGRTTQIRYIERLGATTKLSLGLERLDYLGIENPDTLIGEVSARLPLFSARLDKTWKTGMVAIGASFAELRWDGGINPNPTALQYSVILAGRQYIGRNKSNYFTWNMSTGVGNGENIMSFIGSNANAVLSDSNTLKPMQSLSILFGFMHKWNDKLSSNIAYAYGWLDPPSERDPFSLKRGGIAHVNLIYNTQKHFSTGIEYMFGEQRTVNDALGQASRIQLMAKFEF